MQGLSKSEIKRSIREQINDIEARMLDVEGSIQMAQSYLVNTKRILKRLREYCLALTDEPESTSDKSEQ